MTHARQKPSYVELGVTPRIRAIHSMICSDYKRATGGKFPIASLDFAAFIREHNLLDVIERKSAKNGFVRINEDEEWSMANLTFDATKAISKGLSGGRSYRGVKTLSVAQWVKALKDDAMLEEARAGASGSPSRYK